MKMADKPDTQQYTELLPPTNDAKVGEKVFSLLRECIEEKIRLGLINKWLKHYRLGRNQPWEGKPPAGIPLASVPLLFTHRQRTVNTLTDNNPTFNVPQIDGSQDYSLYQTIGRAADYWWREQEQQGVLEKSIINGETYGVAIEKVLFNPDLEYGIGEVETRVVDPFYFSIYPPSCTDLQKAEAVLYYVPMSVREAKRLWRGKADQIKPDMELISQLNDDRKDYVVPAPNGPRGMMGWFRSMIGGGVNANGVHVKEDQVLVCECWVRDYTMETVKEEKTVTTEDQLGNPVEAIEIVEVTRPKYPGFIRCVISCCGGTVLLEDKPNPSISPLLSTEEAMKTYLYDKFPFVVVNSITDPCTIWGMSDFEQLASLQAEANKCLSQIIYHKDRTARPKIINPKDSGVNNNQFTNLQGIINPASFAAAQGIRYLDFPNNSKDINVVFELVKGLFMLVGGTFDMDQASSVNGDSRLARDSIQMLIERQATMMRGKIRNYYKLIRERGRMFVSLMQNWYTEDRWISFQDQGQDMSMQVNGKSLRIPVRLTVVDGSTMPTSKAAQRDEAIQLAQQGMIDRRALLESLEWPERSEINNRMDQGPNGVLLQRLKQAGFPDPGIQWAQGIGALDDKAFAIQLSKKQLPPPPVQLDPNDPAAQEQMLSNQKMAAEIQKMQADAQLSMAQAQKAMSEIGASTGDPHLTARDEARKDAEIDLKRQAQDTSRLAVIAQIKQGQQMGRREDREDVKSRHAMALDAQAADLEAAKAMMESDHRDKDREADSEANMLAQQTALAQTRMRGNSTTGARQ